MEQWAEEEATEEGLRGRRTRHHRHIYSTTNTSNGANKNGSINGAEGDTMGRLENSVYFEDDQGTTVDLDTKKILSLVTNDQDEKNTKNQGFLPDFGTLSSHNEENKPSSNGGAENVEIVDIIQESDYEEVIELEFERAVKKLDTHTVYCPNCNSCVTKVILRKKGVKTNPQHKRVDLLGCLSCLTLLIPKGNGFNLFPILGRQNPQPIPAAVGNISTSNVANGKGNMDIKQGDCFSLSWIFGNGRENKNTQEPPKEPSNSTYGEGNVVIDIKQGNDDKPYVKGNDDAGALDLFNNPKGGVPNQNGHALSLDDNTPLPGATLPTKSGSDIEETPEVKVQDTSPLGAAASQGTRNVLAEEKPRISSDTDQGSKSLEILKSIVYGGLMESITSLGIVSSAAASDGTTLNIISLGLANLIGGLFIIINNIRDLKNDRFGRTNQTDQQVDQYEELLGRRVNFLLHTTVVLLSFLVFGLIPPLTYGFSFRKSDNRDLKLVAVAAASVLCIILLAIAKAYIRKTSKFYMYIKTVGNYVIIAIMASGVSYAVGDLIKKLMEKLGWFDTSATTTLSLSEMKLTNPALASY